jgi:hypothetical protein
VETYVFEITREQLIEMMSFWFSSNVLIFVCTLLAYNILKMIFTDGYEYIKKKLSERKKRLISD